MTITRSTGYDTGYMGVRAGAGYQGLTEELDAMVRQAADMLTEWTGRDIEIRFNTDRRSGSAWLVDKTTRSTLIGLGADLAPRRPDGWADGKWIDQFVTGMQTLPDELSITTYVAESALIDKGLATEGVRWELHPGVTHVHDAYSYLRHETLEEAMTFLQENTDGEWND
jgi:hypothetical protein